jgi:hypothetical protein
MDTKMLFVVELEDTEDKFIIPIMIVGEDKLANFLLNYDKNRYRLSLIATEGSVIEDYKDFLTKEGLETGKGEENVN